MAFRCSAIVYRCVYISIGRIHLFPWWVCCNFYGMYDGWSIAGAAM
jgi:hypothetical protein